MEARKNFVINAAFYGIILLLLYLGYSVILPILIPFIIGFCVAAVVQLPMRHIKVKSPRQRRLIVSLFVITLYALVVGFAGLFSVSVVNEIGSFVSTLPTLFQNQIYPFLVNLADQVEALLDPIDPELTDWIIEMGKSAASSLGQFATDLSAGAVKLVASSAISIPGVIIQIIITVASSFYIASDYALVLGFLKSLIPESKRHYTIDVLRYARTAVLAFLKTYSILFCVTFLELWIGLSILKIPYSLAIAFGIALFDLMPVLGTGGILLPWTAILVVLGNYGLAIGIAVLYIFITIVRNTLEPRIVGNHIGLHPLATLVAMILGLNLLGLVGMILFPITLVAVTNLKKGAKQVHEAEESA